VTTNPPVHYTEPHTANSHAVYNALHKRIGIVLVDRSVVDHPRFVTPDGYRYLGLDSAAAHTAGRWAHGQVAAS
jgi:hypothetical protein